MLLCRLFGGARLEMVTGKDAEITFKDIAGIEQVKAEIVELVQFLKNPKKFLDLGARSPAGVLLVGAPGTGTPFQLPTEYTMSCLYDCKPLALCTHLLPLVAPPTEHQLPSPVGPADCEEVWCKLRSDHPVALL